VHLVPESAEPPSPRDPGGPAAPGTTNSAGDQARTIDAVLFDFHGTLAQVEDPITWVRAAAADCGVVLEIGEATVLADRLVTAGRAGGPPPYRVPPHLMEVWAERDLYPHAHRAAYTGLASTVPTTIDGLADALYDRGTQPHSWHPYADSVAVLKAVKSAGLAVAVVSNIGFDIRPMIQAFGMSDLIDSLVLSYEIGRIKPDPAIFEYACAALRVDPERTLMVGDSAADAGALAAGCTAYLVPTVDHGRRNGLAAVAALAGAHSPV
jgi:HAD superfamily hydrolase (TIGR01509 family)